jgi:hypothetical protein
MASATAGAPKPRNEKGRLAGRPFGNLIINGDDVDSISTHRAQFLARRNIPHSRLGLLASLIWQVRHD